MCDLRPAALVQENEHCMQVKGLSPECVCMCLLRWSVRVQVYSHCLQLNDFSPVCVCMCLLSLLVFVEVYSHCLQLCGFSPVWTSMCCFRWEAELQEISHILQPWALSPPFFRMVFEGEDIVFSILFDGNYSGAVTVVSEWMLFLRLASLGFALQEGSRWTGDKFRFSKL